MNSKYCESLGLTLDQYGRNLEPSFWRARCARLWIPFSVNQIRDEDDFEFFVAFWGRKNPGSKLRSEMIFFLGLSLLFGALSSGSRNFLALLDCAFHFLRNKIFAIN